MRCVLFAATGSWSGITLKPCSLSTANRPTDNDDDDAVLDPKKESMVLGLFVHNQSISTVPGFDSSIKRSIHKVRTHRGGGGV